MKGRISINKVTCQAPEKDYVIIELEDELSSVEFVQARMSLETFGRALFGLSSLPVEFELRGLDKVGKKLENKIEEVFIPCETELYATDKEIRQAIKKYEVDGWIGRDENAKNHHNWVGYRGIDGYTARVIFRRWVEVEKKG